MALPTPILQVRDLEVSFLTKHGITKAVDRISFEIYPGETVAIVGESGSGKSATALSMLRLIDNKVGEKQNGEAVFFSEKYGRVDLFQLPEKQMQQIRGREISMVFQDPMSSLNPVYTCGKQVAEALLLHTNLTGKRAKEHAIELFKQVKLPGPDKIFDTYPHELSGGQKQRVMVAMAMACKPSILIADEPTTALDVTVQAHVLQLIDELRLKGNTAVLFITHDLGVVAETADRVLVMYKGKIVEQGKVMDIFTNPQHPYTKGLLACRPKLSARSQSKLPTVSDFMLEDAYGNIIEREIKEPESLLAGAEKNSVGSVTDMEHDQKKSQMSPLLQVENLKVYFPIKTGFFGRITDYIKAVDGVSFEVYPGETIGLVGESGSGKTTLGRALLRLIDPTGGRIIFNGNDIGRLNPEELRKARREFQMIFQDPQASLNPLHTVGDAIMEPMRVHNLYQNNTERHVKAMELLDKVGLAEEHFHRYPHEFSGGQQQRICIARALALQPKCIVCDEAVSALDVSVQAQVINLLNQLKHEFQVTYIFITHDLSVAKHIADRTLVMNNGKIVEAGSTEQLFRNPQHDYTRQLINAIPKGETEDIIAAQKRRGKLELDLV